MEEIDYKSVVEQLMGENERLRKRLVARLTGKQSIHIRDWIIENYLLIVVGCVVLSCFLAFIEVVNNARRA